MSGRYRGGCSALKDAGFDIGSCCSSCHEDVLYGYELCEIDLPNGDWLHVCCRVAGEMEETDEAQMLAALDERADA